MRARALLAATLLLALLTAAAFLVPEAGRAGAAEGGTGARARPSAADVALRAPARAREEPGPLGVPSVRAAGDPRAPAAATSPAACALDVVVLDEASADPLPGATVTLLRADGLPLVCVAADEAGRAVVPARAGEAGTLQVVNVFGSPGRRGVAFEPLEPGERRRVEVRLDAGYHHPFSGYVVADESGLAVRGARVRVFDRLVRVGLSGHDLGKHTYLELEVDGAGAFDLWYQREVKAFVEAPDRPRTFFRVSDRGRAPGEPLEIRLPLAAEVVVAVRDALSDAVAGARVRLSASPGDVTAGALPVGMVDMAEWRAHTAADGSCRLGGLPPGVRIRVALEHGSEELEVFDLIRLEPGETRALELVTGS